MKKSIILKSFLVILMCGMLIFAITPVYAATDEGFEDILNDNTSNTGNTSGNSASTNSANRNTNSSNVQNLNALRNNAANRANTANTANTLPKTGVADSLPTVLLVVVFAISAVYAYKKIKDYRNID